MPKKKAAETVQTTLTLESDIGLIDFLGRVEEERLRSAGVHTVGDLLALSQQELEELVGENKAKMLIDLALQVAGGGIITAKELAERRRGIRRISTGVMALDELLGGGIETRAVTEIVGEFGSGKTQLCHQLAVMVQLPEDKGGLKSKAIYLDTENTFRPERIMQIAKARGLDPDQALNNIFYARIYNSEHLYAVMPKVRSLIREHGAALLIIDSIIAHFRAEYPGRENLAERQQKLNQLISALLRIADVYNVAVVVTNQVMAQPDAFVGNPLRPAGGNIIAHGATYRIWLRKTRENTRIARIFDSPYHPEGEVSFRITDEGVVDA